MMMTTNGRTKNSPSQNMLGASRPATGDRQAATGDRGRLTMLFITDSTGYSIRRAPASVYKHERIVGGPTEPAMLAALPVCLAIERGARVRLPHAERLVAIAHPHQN